MLHLRLVVPAEKTPAVLELLAGDRAACNTALLRGVAIEPAGDVVLTDVVNEGANRVITKLRGLGVHHDGSISIERVEAEISDAVMRAEAAEPGATQDAIIWEETEARMRDESRFSVSFVTLMVMATLIAAVGIALDSPVLVVGAMAIGPDYGPVAAGAFFLQKRRPRRAYVAIRTLAIGLTAGIVAAFLLAVVAKAAGLDAFDSYRSLRPLTGFTAEPGLVSFIVAAVAGVAGAISVTEGRSGAITGVLVSVTTIPAAANIGVAAAFTVWSDAVAAGLQLALNVATLLVAGMVTIEVERRYGRHLVRWFD